MNGILIVDKPKGLTSHDIVDFIRKRFHIKKAGHTGTLDPQTTGVLVILMGIFTKKSKEFVNHDKEYEACLTLGIATDTLDAQGQITKTEKLTYYNLQEIKDVFNQFLGKSKQVPPMFSALKYKGKRLYKLARQNIEIERPARQISIYNIKITRFMFPQIYFTVKCSKGTYIRTLCADIAQRLGSAGYMSELRRTRSGPFAARQAITMDELKSLSRRDLTKCLLKSVPGLNRQ